VDSRCQRARPLPGDTAVLRARRLMADQGALFFSKRCLTQTFISFIGSDRAVTNMKEMKEMKICIGMHPYVI
jgi:hypothetical protein